MKKTIRITSHITLVLTLLTAMVAVLIAGFVWLASVKVDDISQARQQGFVERDFTKEIQALPREMESLARWDDAILFSRSGNHQWIADNIGGRAHSYFGHDRIFLFNEKDDLVFVMRDGVDGAQPAFSGDETHVSIIRQQIRSMLRGRERPDNVPSRALADISLVEVVPIGERPAAISARPLVPSTKRVSVEPGSEFIIVAVKFLDTRVVDNIADFAQLESLHYSLEQPGSQAALPVVSSSGVTLGYLAWEPITPGRMLIQRILPVGIVSVIAAMAGVAFLGRGLHRTSVELQQSEMALLRHRDDLEETVRLRTAEIERQREELDRLLAQERHVNALQRQFVTMASHEFRTPLAIIDAAAQRLSRTKTRLKPDYVEEKSAQIRSAVLRMVDLMESILSAGRLETGKTILKPERLSLVELIETCCARQMDIRKSHTFHRDLSHLPQTILADRATIEQVFTNLLSNAVKYAPQAPDIHIRTWTKGGMSYVSIQDTGIGMDAEDLPKLFQPYYRARSATGIAGTGIGLNIVKQIVDLHGGSISVESVLGQGTKFTVALPNDGPLANLVKQAA